MRSAAALLVWALLAATVPAQSWIARYNGSGNDEDQPRAIATDGSGNCYVTGTSWGTGTSYDWATVKYGPFGDSLWVVRYDGADHGSDEARALVAGSAAVIVTGGTSLADLTTDVLTTAYSPAGAVIWTAQYDGPAGKNDLALTAGLDGSANVYAAGYSGGDTTGWDCLTIKYGADGQRRWVGRYGTIDEDYVVAVRVDGDGNVYAAGSSGSPYTSSWDYVLIKYDSSGSERWVTRYNGAGNGSDEVHGLALDAAGNAYVTGSSERAGTSSDFATIKYNPQGETLWVRIWDGPAHGPDCANAIALGADGSVYVTGYSLDAANDYDFLTLKYDADGNQQWAVGYDGPGHGYDEAVAIAVDNDGGCYITGTSTGSASRTDYATVKYNAVGGGEWAYRYDGPAGRLDEARALALDPDGGVCITGASTGSGTGLDYATVRYLRTGISEKPGAALESRVQMEACALSSGPARIRYYLPIAGFVSLSVLDAAGRTAVRLVAEEQEPGDHVVELRPESGMMADGVYFARLDVRAVDGSVSSRSAKLIRSR